MNWLSCLESPPGANKKKKRLGRGDSSGHGGTSTKGHKGQRARSGGFHKPGFEGGQMPLSRRVPKRGFHNPFRVEFNVVNIAELAQFSSGSIVDLDSLMKKGLVRKKRLPLKILGDGDLPHALTVKAHQFSKSAADKIQKSGGSVEILQIKGQ